MTQLNTYLVETDNLSESLAFMHKHKYYHTYFTYMVTTLEDELNEIDNDVKWLHGNYNELINQYNEDYIAIKNQNIIDQLMIN
jgi:hypothetical protein